MKQLYEFSVLCRTTIVVAAESDGQALDAVNGYSASYLINMGDDGGDGNVVEIDLVEVRDCPDDFDGDPSELAHIDVPFS